MVILNFVLSNGEPYRKYLPIFTLYEARALARHLRLSADEKLFTLKKVTYVTDSEYTDI